MEVSSPGPKTAVLHTTSGVVLANPPRDVSAMLDPEGGHTIALFPRLTDNAALESGDAAVHTIGRPGEFEVGSAYIQGVAVAPRIEHQNDDDIDIIHVVDDGALRVGVLADLRTIPEKAARTALNNLHALIVIPNPSLDSSSLASLVRDIDVKLVLVVGGAADDTIAEPLQKLLKELGSGDDVQRLASFTVKASAPSQDKATVVVLKVK